MHWCISHKCIKNLDLFSNPVQKMQEKVETLDNPTNQSRFSSNENDLLRYARQVLGESSLLLICKSNSCTALFDINAYKTLMDSVTMFRKCKKSKKCWIIQLINQDFHQTRMTSFDMQGNYLVLLKPRSGSWNF